MKESNHINNSKESFSSSTMIPKKIFMLNKKLSAIVVFESIL